MTEPADELGTYQAGEPTEDDLEDLRQKFRQLFDNENQSHLASQTVPWDEEKDD